MSTEPRFIQAFPKKNLLKIRAAALIATGKRETVIKALREVHFMPVM
jgi:hypothetical protein